MACLITGSDDAARRIVSEVLQAAATPIDSTGGIGASETGTRATLVSRAALVSAIFRACRAVLDAEARVVEGTHDSIDWMARISAQQRSAVALYLYGAQTPAQIGSLLSLPTRAVSLLLLSALDELATAEPPRRLRAIHHAQH